MGSFVTVVEQADRIDEVATKVDAKDDRIDEVEAEDYRLVAVCDAPIA